MYSNGDQMSVTILIYWHRYVNTCRGVHSNGTKSYYHAPGRYVGRFLCAINWREIYNYVLQLYYVNKQSDCNELNAILHAYRGKLRNVCRQL